MGNFWDDFVDVNEFQGNDPVSQILNPSPPPGPGPNEQALLKLYQRLISQTDPLRRNLISDSRSFLKHGLNKFDVAKTPQYQFARDMANQQSQGARDNILSTMPNGGVLLDKLADVDIGKAQTLTQAASDIYSNEFNNRRNQAMSLATGGTFQGGIQGMEGLAQRDVARDQAYAAQQASQKGGAGAAAGSYLGSK